MEYRDLNARPKESLRNTVDRLRDEVRSSKTGSSGVKDLGEHGDVVWLSPGTDGVPVQKSVKRFSVELDDVTAQAEALAEALQDAREAIDEAAQELAEEIAGLGRVETSVPPPATPVVGKTLWVAPSGRVFRAVECEDEEEES